MRPIAAIASDLDFDLLGLVRVRFWRLEMKIGSSNIWRMGIAAAATLAFQSQPAHADENGVSLWVPHLFGSLAAAPRLQDGRSARWPITSPWQLPATLRSHAKSR